MAKGAYLGINDTARKVKNIYVGVNGVARKIKKAYIGDENNIARLCWGGEINVAIGTFTGTGSEKTITISGLPFRPTHLIISSAHSNLTSYYNLRIATFVSQNITGHPYDTMINLTSGSIVTTTSSSITVDFGDGYFTATNGASTVPFRYNYNYVAWRE